MQTQTTNQKATVVAAGQGKKMTVLGHSVTVKISKQEAEGNYYVFELITPPGLGIPPHVHDREDEFIFVVEGEFEIMLGNKKYVAKAGDEVFCPRHIPHAFQNIGSKPGKTLWTIVPGGDFEEFFNQLEALPAGEPDLQKVAEIFASYGMEILVNAKA